ncbi:thiamine diphosphokinase [Pontibacillus litoralis]|uniref:thiamine diphosphokinase n=1 Tax=Pontibacillus litoralis TaxID=516703 RepID=UPI000561C463|nr:thiamine diphosphokinase [Pontibacillus litoralis]
MTKVAIVGGGPMKHIPNLTEYNEENMIWIGADHGCKVLIQQGIRPNYCVGDFDSVTEEELQLIRDASHSIEEYEAEKDETDLEIALRKALSFHPTVLYFFGVTGGRLDHELVNLQLLHTVEQHKVRGIIVDNGNWVELKVPGTYKIEHDDAFSNLSFIPFTPEIKGLTLSSFYYPLENATVQWGSTLSISNKLISESGTFSFREGIVLLVKSRDVLEP